LVLATVAAAADWPQWLGPHRDSVWREDGIVEVFPDSGLPVLWRSPIGLGYAGPAVAAGRVYVMDYELISGKLTNNPGARDELRGRERVLCLDAQSGRQRWVHQYERPYNLSYAGGPRCTPSVVDGKVYALGAEGNLWCLDAQDGRVLWSVDFVQQYQATIPIWGIAAHPLVDGDYVYCVVGGENSVVVAFDRQSGREAWRALSAREQGYCPPTIIEHAGIRQLLVWHAESLNSLDPETGKANWEVPLEPRFGMAIAAPRLAGSQLLATNYGVAALLQLSDNQSAPTVVWRGEPKTALYAANCQPLVEDGVIYGCDIDTGALMGVRLADAQRLWQTMAPTTGGDRRAAYGTTFLVKQADRFVLFNEQGDLILARLSAEGYQEISRFHVLEATNNTFGRPVVWSHPAFANRCVYARNDQEIVCVNLAAAK
jgi:outer membrane protein assembly factor BamB